jgi:RHS repeat-associated protein
MKLFKKLLVFSLLLLGMGDSLAQTIPTSVNLMTLPSAPEIKELARGLGNDPIKIFNWVRKNIRSQPYFAASKGALTTLLQGAGGDVDQSLLLFALLKEAGHVPLIHIAPVEYSIDRDFPSQGIPEIPLGWSHITPGWPLNWPRQCLLGSDCDGDINRKYNWLLTQLVSHRNYLNTNIGSLNIYSYEIKIDRARVSVSSPVSSTNPNGRLYFDPWRRVTPIGAPDPTLTVTNGPGLDLSSAALKGQLGAIPNQSLVQPPLSATLSQTWCDAVKQDTDLRSFLSAASATALQILNSKSGTKAGVEDLFTHFWVRSSPYLPIIGHTTYDAVTTASGGSVGSSTLASADMAKIKIRIVYPGTQATSTFRHLLPTELDGAGLGVIVEPSGDQISVGLIREGVVLEWGGTPGTMLTLSNQCRLECTVETPSGEQSRQYPLSVAQRSLWHLEFAPYFHSSRVSTARCLRLLTEARLALAESEQNFSFPVAVGPDRPRKEHLLLRALALQSNQYLSQMGLTSLLIGQYNNCDFRGLSCNGRVFQSTAGNTIDVLFDADVMPLSGLWADCLKTIHLALVFISAFEHAVIEQSGGLGLDGATNTVGVSTARIIREVFNNQENGVSEWTRIVAARKIGPSRSVFLSYVDEPDVPLHFGYQGTGAAASMREFLLRPAAPPADQNLVLENGQVLIYPIRGNPMLKLPPPIPARNMGYGYGGFSNTGGTQIISGLGGGKSYARYNVNPVVVQPSLFQRVASTLTVFRQQGTQILSRAANAVSSVGTRTFGADPVDLSTGAFVYANADLEIGGAAAPRGLGMMRSYNSAGAAFDSTGLGGGWSHSWALGATPRTDFFAGLGLESPEAFLPMLVAVQAASNVHTGNLATMTATDYTLLYLIACWAVDQITYNSVAVDLGPESLSFVRIPGADQWQCLSGTATLKNIPATNGGTDGKYEVTARNGNTYTFHRDPANPMVVIKDRDLRALTANFHPNGRVNNVTDAAGRQLNFVYSGAAGAGRLNNVSASKSATLTGGANSRGVGYVYNAKGVLDTFTDAEARVWKYEYLAPPATTPDADTRWRLMTRQLNPAQQVIVRNEYDELGRVKIQYSQGMDAVGNLHRSEFKYTGSYTQEVDAENYSDVHFYDHRGREHALQTKPFRSGAASPVLRRGFDANGDLLAQENYPSMAAAELDPLGAPVTGGGLSREALALAAPRPLFAGRTEYLYGSHREQTGMYQYERDPSGNVFLRRKTSSEYEPFLDQNIVRLTRSVITKDKPNAPANDPSLKITRVVYAPGAPSVKPLFVYDGDTNLSFSGITYTGGTVAATGLPATETDREGYQTTYTYDSFGNPDKVSGIGGVVDYDYDWTGDLVTTTSGSGVNLVTVSSLFTNGRQLQTSTTTNGGQGLTTERAFDAAGRAFEQYHYFTGDPAGTRRQFSRTYFDGLDAVTKTVAGHASGFPTPAQEPAYPASITEYDLRDSAWKTTDTVFGLSTRTYFNPDRSPSLVSENYLPQSARTQSVFVHDFFGDLTDTTDARARVTRDSVARNTPNILPGINGDVTTTTFAGVSTSSAVDFAGRPRTFSNARGKTFRMDYDLNDALLSTTTPLGYRQRRVLDRDGRIKQIWEHTPGNATGTQTAEYQLHLPVTPAASAAATTAAQLNAGRVSQITFSLSAPPVTVQFASYSADGRPGVITENGKTISRTFVGNRVKTYKSWDLAEDPLDEGGYALSYDYWPDGSIKTVYYPNMDDPDDTVLNAQRSVGYVYYHDGSLYQVTDNFTTPPAVTTYTWTLAGALDTVTRPNGSVRKHRYDTGGRLFAIDERMASGTLIATSRVDLGIDDRIENKLAIPALAKNQNLISFSGAQYDDDNRLTNTLSGVNFSYTSAGNFGGNMENGFTLKPQAPQQLVFDSRSRLHKVIPRNGQAEDVSRPRITYTYDSEGVRLSRSEGTGAIAGDGSRAVNTLTRFIMDAASAGTPRLLVRRKGTAWVRYVYGVGLLHEYTSSGARSYYHCDDTASVIAMTNPAGTVIARFKFTPYGQLSHYSNPSLPPAPPFVGPLQFPLADNRPEIDTPFGFGGMAGVVTDPDGLIHMGARYYSSVLGRFLSSDPAGFDGGTNWHAYASGNPLDFIDPSGYGPSSVASLVKGALNVLSFIPGVGIFSSGILAMWSAAEGDTAGALGHLASVALGGAAAIAKFARPAGSMVASVVNTGRTYSPHVPVALPPPPPPKMIATPSNSSGLGVGCFVAGTPVAVSSKLVPIQDIRPGDRVETDKTLSGGTTPTTVDPTTWKLITLSMANPGQPGESIRLQLLRSPAWVAEQGAREGSPTYLEVEEMGMVGWATVEAIAPCPAITEGSGRVVLGTMTHLNTFLREIRFQGVDPPLQTTATHRFFSEDRKDWATSDELQAGETLRAKGGTIQISGIAETPGSSQVYNIEVETDHVYYAGGQKILSHNSCAAKTGPGAADDIYVIGRQVDTTVAKDWAGHKILDIPNWTLKKNDAWVQGIIDSRAKVYIGTPQTQKTLWDAANSRPTVFARELEQLQGAGYKQVGDYMHPPGL